MAQIYYIFVSTIYCSAETSCNVRAPIRHLRNCLTISPFDALLLWVTAMRGSDSTNSPGLYIARRIPHAPNSLWSLLFAPSKAKTKQKHADGVRNKTNLTAASLAVIFGYF